MKSSSDGGSPKGQRPEGHLAGWQIMAGLAVGIAMVWVLGVKDASNPVESDQTAQATPFMAFVQCQSFVKEHLKSPATAQFPGKPLSALSNGSSEFLVTSTVDSQNGFGALVRSDWLCKTSYKGGNPASPSSWELESISIQ